MSIVHDLTRGHKQLRGLIDFALREGWEVVRTSGGHLKFMKPGLSPIYTGSTASDYRAERNARAQLRRAGRQTGTRGNDHG